MFPTKRSNWWDDIDRYHRELKKHLKRLSMTDCPCQPLPALLPPPLLSSPLSVSPAPLVPSFNELIYPWKDMIDRMEQQVGSMASIERDQDKYQVILDVQQFAPEEITVKTDDKYITVEGKHEEKEDQHGYVSRHFVRRYMLPQGYDMGHVKPSLSSDGILTITAPRLVLPAPGERIVPIKRSNVPSIKAV